MSRAAEPGPAMVEQVRALWRSGYVKPLKPLATPWLLEADDARAIGEGLQALQAAVEQVLRWWADDAPFLPPVALPERIVQAAHTDARAGRLLTFTRYDLVCPADEPARFQLLEVQAGDPSAMGWHDALGAAMQEGLPGNAAPLWMMPSHHDVFVKRVKHRRIAFVVAKGSIVESDHALLAAYYRSRGWEAVVADPATLSFESGTLRADGHEVDAVFRDAVDELMTSDALLEAHRTGAVQVLNSFAAAVADDKGLLEVLSSPERWDARLGAVLQAHVPWTRRLVERKVEWEGRVEDLVPLARRLREALVLKPVDGYGGFGVVVGRFVDQAAWDRALAEAVGGPRRFVVQRYVPLPVQRVFSLGEEVAPLGPAPPRPLSPWGEGQEREPLGGEGLVADERSVVHSFWLHEGRFAGGFMRASANPVVNVHQGGGLAPVFFHPPFR